MKITTVNDYSVLSAPLFTDMESVPDMSKILSKKSTLIKKGNTGTHCNKGKTNKKSNKSVLVAKTFKLPPDLVLYVKRIAYWRRIKIQDVVADALKGYIDAASEDDVREIPR